MSTSTTPLHVDRRSLSIAQALVDARWELVTGERFPERPSHVFAWDAVIVATAGRSARIRTEQTALRFEGYEEEYPTLSVLGDDEGLAAALAEGKAYYQHRGQQVVRVLVVRESITRLLQGVPTWTFSTDYGLVFELADGAVAVTKAGHHSEALDVAIAGSLAGIDIPDRSIEWDWDNELGEEYQVSRDLIPASELLRDVEGS